MACSSRDKKNLSRAIKSMKFSTYQFCSMIGTTKRERSYWNEVRVNSNRTKGATQMRNMMTGQNCMNCMCRMSFSRAVTWHRCRLICCASIILYDHVSDARE